jgi:hypothetical protein
MKGVTVMSFDKNLLLRSWLHAHEEDAPDRVVFRPASYSLPPSRGRSGYTFFPDGHAIKISPGPADRPIQVRGTWSMDDEGKITICIPDQLDIVLEINDLNADWMIIKKQ